MEPTAAPDPNDIARRASSGERPLVKFEVQTVPEIMRDMRANRPLITKSLIILVCWWLVSSLAFTFTEAGNIQSTQCPGCLPAGPWLQRFGDALYFTLINMTSVGFGDYAPHTALSKVLAGLNALVGLGAVGWVVAIASAALSGPGGGHGGRERDAGELPTESDGGADDREQGVADHLERRDQAGSDAIDDLKRQRDEIGNEIDKRRRGQLLDLARGVVVPPDSEPAKRTLEDLLARDQELKVEMGKMMEKRDLIDSQITDMRRTQLRRMRLEAIELGSAAKRKDVLAKLFRDEFTQPFIARVSGTGSERATVIEIEVPIRRRRQM